MKKAFLCIAVLCTLIFGISCSQGKRYGILEYQKNDITAECTVNGKYDVKMQKAVSDFQKQFGLSGLGFDKNTWDLLTEIYNKMKA